MSDIRGSDLKSVTVEFHTANEARKALKVFNKFEYRNGKDLYLINAYLELGQPRRRSPSPYHYGQDRFDSYSRGRSRSPHYETSKLDLEIELLRKQRLIVEEERRLLFEKKKLELVKEFGPSALQEFESSEFSRSRPRDYRPREPSPFRSRPNKRSRPNRPKTPPQRRMPTLSKKLPNFLWPCKLILTDMKDLIFASGLESMREISILDKMIRITIRKRLVVLCENKPIMSATEVAALYRARYPKTTDETLVAKHLKDLRGSHMSIDDGEIGKVTKKDNTKQPGRRANEEKVEKKSGEKINEGEKTIKIEGPNEVEQDKTEKQSEVHNVTDTTDLTGTAFEVKEIKLETTDITGAVSNTDINIPKKELVIKEETIHTEEVIPNKKKIIPKEKEILNEDEVIPNNEKVMLDKVISNEKEQNEANIENMEEKSVNLDDLIGSDSNGIVMDEANMDDWTEGDGEEWK
ncbi:uncharacterized protein LOC113233686 isoform X2 [Hyposmocoma kahamanoa]|nr:uncharacterized protein LOC113233686 isoform X2 [Hyposmocoma kahamanoa]